MARYTVLSPIYTPGGVYCEIGATVGDEGVSGDIPIPVSYVPTPALDPLNASAISKLLATRNGTQFVPPPSPSLCILGLWGLRTQFSTLPLVGPSDAWKNLVKQEN